MAEFGDIAKMLEKRLAPFEPLFLRVERWGRRKGIDGIANSLVGFVTVVGGAYLLATVVSVVAMRSMVGSITAARAHSRTVDNENFVSLNIHSVNYRDLVRAIKERNIFNSEGKFPDDRATDLDKRDPGAGFDINGPCRPTSLNIQLVGTIFLGDRMRSIATVQDKTYTEADVYKVGDTLIGNDGVVIAAVERQALILNNNGTKECIDLDKKQNGGAMDGFPGTSGGSDNGGFPNVAPSSGDVTLESSFVESELGPGFGKIIESARLVPNPTEGGINGFKIFAIRPGSIFSRMGLQNNDVITQVNDVSLKQAEQGFALYQALQDEKEIRLQLLRNGSVPTNVTVRIK